MKSAMPLQAADILLAVPEAQRKQMQEAVGRIWHRCSRPIPRTLQTPAHMQDLIKHLEGGYVRCGSLIYNQLDAGCMLTHERCHRDLTGLHFAFVVKQCTSRRTQRRFVWALPLIREDLTRRRTANLAQAEQQPPDVAPSLPAPFAGDYTQVHKSCPSAGLLSDWPGSSGSGLDSTVAPFHRLRVLAFTSAATALACLLV